MWDPATGTVMQSLTIPRAVCVLASGNAAETQGTVTLEVSAGASDVVQSPFMQEKARTTSFTHKVTVDGDKMSYAETTMLEIYGRTFEHTDENDLERQ